MASLQSLGSAALAEAKFTFLCGAWGCVQSLGPAEPRIVVKVGLTEPVLSPPLCSPEERGPQQGARTWEEWSVLKEGSVQPASTEGPLWLPLRPKGLLSSW